MVYVRLRGVPFFIKLASIGITVLIAYGIFHAYQRTSFGLRRDQAARRGIEWLLAHKDAVPPSAAAWLLTDVYNVIDDDTIKQKLARSINEKHAIVAQETISLHDNGQTITDKDLYLMAERIFSRMCLGVDVTNDVAVLNRYISTMKPTDDLGFLYLLKALGIEDRTRYQEYVVTTKELFEHSLSQSSIKVFPNGLSFVTHRLLYESDYLRGRLDPTQFAFERAYIQRALSSLSDDPAVVRNNIDLLSQALFSLQLLHEQPDDKVRLLYDSLLNVQSKDGSWSQKSDNIEFTFHNTAMAVVALTTFSAKGNINSTTCQGY